MKPITYLRGDATRPEGDGPKIIVHCVNDIGAWGAGFVLALSRRWAAPREAYLSAVAAYDGQLLLGDVQFADVGDDITVANLVGQRGVGQHGGLAPIRYQAVTDGLIAVCREAQRRRASVHMPRMGCGLAGGSWAAVEKLVEMTLCAFDIPVTVYDLPAGEPEEAP